MDFTPAHAAGLGATDLARLLKVNRVTVSLWLNGHTSPHRLLQEDLARLLDTVRKAVEAGELPVPHKVSRRERSYYIRTALDRQAAD